MMDAIRKLLIHPTSDTRIQLVRYVFVGGVAFLLDFGTLWTLTSLLGFHYLISAAIAFLVGLATNYLLSVAWVFAEHRLSSRSGEFLGFALIGLAGLGLNEIGMWVICGCIGFDYRVAKILTTLIVFVWNFVARKFLLFRANPSSVS